MLHEAEQLEQVGRHEVQYSIVTLGRDKEFSKLMEHELPQLEESLVSRFGSRQFVFKHFLYKKMDLYYLSVEITLAHKKLVYNVLINDSGPAFVIQTPDQEYSLLSGKRIKETLFDLIIQQFES